MVSSFMIRNRKGNITPTPYVTHGYMAYRVIRKQAHAPTKSQDTYF